MFLFVPKFDKIGSLSCKNCLENSLLNVLHRIGGLKATNPPCDTRRNFRDNTKFRHYRHTAQF